METSIRLRGTEGGRGDEKDEVGGTGPLGLSRAPFSAHRCEGAESDVSILFQSETLLRSGRSLPSLRATPD